MQAVNNLPPETGWNIWPGGTSRDITKESSGCGGDGYLLEAE